MTSSHVFVHILRSGPDPTGLDSTAVLAICLSAGIFFSTIHTQDFKDCDGDRLVGRETIPIVFPNHGRKTVVVALLAWSFALSRIWNLDTLLASGFLGFAAFIGARFLLYTSIADDQVSFYLYNVCATSPRLAQYTFLLVLLLGVVVLRPCATGLLEDFSEPCAISNGRGHHG